MTTDEERETEPSIVAAAVVLCGHGREVTERDENADRIRTIETCHTCDRTWSGCYAKRLDEEGRTAWGPPGEWWFKEWDVPR